MTSEEADADHDEDTQSFFWCQTFTSVTSGEESPESLVSGMQ